MAALCRRRSQLGARPFGRVHPGEDDRAAIGIGEHDEASPRRVLGRPQNRKPGFRRLPLALVGIPDGEPHGRPADTIAGREDAPLVVTPVVAVQHHAAERGYSAIQSTKPQTLGYALNDSPAGLAAWILEKWRSGSDRGGDLESRFARDFLLMIVTLYWVTATITSSIRDYYDNRRWHGEPRLSPGDTVRVPTAVAVFPHMLIPEGEPPSQWAERLYDIRRWTVMPRGGHFAPAEEPELLARDIAAFFASTDW